MRDVKEIEPVRRTVEVGCPAAEAFRLFTDDIDTWWPLASHSIGEGKAVSCVFERGAGGRIFETHRDESVHLWGTVTIWDPPRRLVFTWHPGRDEESAQEVEIRFIDCRTGTRVELEHRRWETLGERAREVRGGYATGWIPVLERFVSRATSIS